jgi:hypothetical protein
MRGLSGISGSLRKTLNLIKLGHGLSQISTDIWFFVAFNFLIIRVHPCPQNFACLFLFNIVNSAVNVAEVKSRKQFLIYRK